MTNQPSIAIIGAGMAGLTLATLLERAGLKATVFDKGRSVGGRMSTRYSAQTDYDHGAQFFTVRTPGFSAFLADFADSYVEWQAKVTTLSPNKDPYKRPWFEPHYVASPRMNGLCKQIASNLHVHTGHKILKVTGNKDQWWLETDNGLAGPFNWVISTAPLPQTAALMPLELPKVEYSPVFALMTPLAERPGFDAAVVQDSPLSWLAVTNSKPERPIEKICLTAHAEDDWSEEHVEAPHEQITSNLLEALEVLGLQPEHDYATLHRWLYGRVKQPADMPFILDVELGLGACGDWGAGTRVEDAFTSASQLYAELLPEIV